MGKIIERIKVSNFADPSKSKQFDATIDTGATLAVLPADVIQELGLRKLREVAVRYANNTRAKKRIYGVVTLEMLGRAGEFDVLEEEAGTQPLIGQLVLEQLDLHVDPKGRRLLPNPESPDAPLLEIL